MGKTLLLQQVYKDEMTKEFDLKMWICVSNNFDVNRVIANMLESLQKSLESLVNSKKFLLVLDDIWDEDKEQDKNKWENVLAPLPSGKLGSKILVTTRMAYVALMISNVLKKKNEMLRFDGLKDDECLLLLLRYAFANLETFNAHHFFCSLSTSIIGAMAAEWFVGPIMDKIINACSDYLQEQVGWQMGIKKELESLRENHPKIQAVVFAANQAQISDQNHPINKWIWQLRDAIDEANDVLDEFEYMKHQEQLTTNTEETKKRKFTSFLSEIPCKILKIGERVLKRDPNLKRLEEAVQKLDKVSADVTTFLRLLDSTKQEQKEQEVDFYKTRETGSLPTNDLIGRGDAKEFVMQWLRKPSNEHRGTDLYRNISLLSIVGHGGMGKTTLLQHVYEDEMTKEFFDLKMWVCVSNNFDVKKVIVDMLSTLKKERPRLDESLDALQNSLRTEIMSKKFLLILDDIWEEEKKHDISKWEKVLAPLAYGKIDSGILVTTRMDSVATMIAKVIQKEKKTFKLQGLEEDQLEALEDWFEAGVAAEDGCLFPRLIKLWLYNCPQLKELPSLPSKLKLLSIKNIGWTTLNFCSNSNPIPLTALQIYRCPNITSLPLADEIARLAALRSLRIITCPNLISLGRYREVETTNNCHLMLSYLGINDPSVLLMEPLRSNAALKKLSIQHNDEVVSFPNEAEQWFLNVRSSLSELKFSFLKSLQSLPSSLESLSSLQKLSIYDVPMLRELPNLPPSLERLTIWGCHPELKERYGADGGSDRHKIAHIPIIFISPKR
ncbi:Disease resistance protein RGA2 [Dendrobium catenatum]|uniref:Disease resistance protein RGA2 n=1 Tax=Dendrobium catenatum TaxID=906689 RepID=A0A2I0VWY4_9ASPA|nr:Disease resistance protein RGA2 [Dendrobium catenatum]